MTIPPLTTAVIATPELVAELKAQAVAGARPFSAEGLLLIASRLVTGRTVRYVDASGQTVGEEVVA